MSPDFSGIIIGNAEFHDGPSPGIISFSGGGTFGSSEALFSPNPDRVLQTSRLAKTNVDGVNGFSVHWDSWGIDDGTHFLYSNVVGGSNASSQTIEKGLLVVGVGDFYAMTMGTAEFRSTSAKSAFTGFAAKGPVTSVSGGFDVNFGTGAVTNGSLSLKIVNPVTDLEQNGKCFLMAQPVALRLYKMPVVLTPLPTLKDSPLLGVKFIIIAFYRQPPIPSKAILLAYWRVQVV